MKNPMTPAGIEPAFFRVVAQHLNHCATAVPVYLPVVCMNALLEPDTMPYFYGELLDFQTSYIIRVTTSKRVR